MAKITQLESGLANQLPRQSGSRARITPPSNSHRSQYSPDLVGYQTEDIPMQGLFMDTSRSLPCWAEKCTITAPGKGAKRATLGLALEAPALPRTPAVMLRNCRPIPSRHQNGGVEVGGAEILESPNGEGSRGAMQITCFLLGVSLLKAWRSAPPSHELA